MTDSGRTYSRGEFLSFLLGKAPKKSRGIPLPYITDKGRAQEQCPDCGAPCLTVCPQRIVYKKDEEVPRLIFETAGCTFCKECALACERGVLSPEQEGPITAHIHLDFTRCLAWQNTLCQSCREACPEEAIFFEGLRNPNIRKDVCTRCGLCVPVCPVSCMEITVSK
ncbi:MAG: ferredoxin-type protein NapF [Calditrichaeota bacterium]|nr:MAG: ferredoxin-type protein NapF [Calditrichota bacterium]